MISLIEELKSEARLLHKQARQGELLALARLGRKPGQDTKDIQRRHCLQAIAKELGFAGWPHAVSVFRGDEVSDFGTLLYPSGGAAHTNIWCATYKEAHEIWLESGGYLLPYKGQFFIADSHFIVTLGLDPNDPDWQWCGRDWVHPKNVEARSRLYHKVVHART